MKSKNEMLTEMILDVTEIGETYSTGQIKSRLFDWVGPYRGNRQKYIPHASGLSLLLAKTNAFDKEMTHNGLLWTRKEVEV